MLKKKVKKVERVFIEVMVNATHDKCAFNGIPCVYLKEQRMAFDTTTRCTFGYCAIFKCALTDFDGTGYMNRCRACIVQSTVKEVNE